MAANEVPGNNPKVEPAVQPVVAGSELEDLDKALLEMDPQFAKELETMKKVQSSADVQIESAVVGDEFGGEDENPAAVPPKRWKRWLALSRAYIVSRFFRTITYLIVFFKTVPKEFTLYSWANLKRTAQTMQKWIRAFMLLPRIQKNGILVFIVLVGVMISIVNANLKGHWLPSLYPPILASFANHADASFDFNPVADTIPFFKAFPQDPEIFLFQKIKVNLRRGQEHSNPMGAFEIYAQVDSHDTAIEVQSRQVELHDLIQRVIEGQSYNELVSELGKNRLRGLLKKEIDHQLTQGWVTDIHYKTFVLKP